MVSFASAEVNILNPPDFGNAYDDDVTLEWEAYAVCEDVSVYLHINNNFVQDYSYNNADSYVQYSYSGSEVTDLEEGTTVEWEAGIDMAQSSCVSDDEDYQNAQFTTDHHDLTVTNRFPTTETTNNNPEVGVDYDIAGTTDWNIYVNNSLKTGSNSAGSGQRASSTFDLSDGYYEVTAEFYDPDFEDNGYNDELITTETWDFSVVPENTAPDTPTLTSPNDGATGTSTDADLQVSVSDPDGDSMDVKFYDASDDSVIGTNTGVADGGTASVTWSDLNYGTDHSWYAVADDGSLTTQSSTWSFTTTYLNKTSNSEAPTGYAWIESGSLIWVSGGTEHALTNTNVVDSNSPGQIGSLWIEGKSLHWIDVAGSERSYQGSSFDTNTGAANGYTWIENDLIHYVDTNGVERVVDGS